MDTGFADGSSRAVVPGGYTNRFYHTRESALFSFAAMSVLDLLGSVSTNSEVTGDTFTGAVANASGGDRPQPRSDDSLGPWLG
jgi:hypothetical protein